MKNRTVLDSVDKVIDALGGPNTLSKRLGVVRSSVDNWKLKGKIPLSQILPVLLALSSRGFLLSAELINIKNVEGLIFAGAYHPKYESGLNKNQNNSNSEEAEAELELFQHAAE